MVEPDRLPLIHEMIEAQARRTPEATAAVFHDRSLSYRELIGAARELAKRLRSDGIGPEAIVAVCLDRSLDMLVALIAVLKAGGAYLPLDPAFPAERVAFMVDDSRATVVITDSAKLRRFEGQAITAISIDEPPPMPSASAVGESLKLEPANLAYLIYTSGSTGKPKGVMIEHRNVANFFAGMDEVLGVEPGTWLAVTSISFDISVLELLWTLTRGFTIVIQDDEEKLLASGQYSIAEQIKRHRVTHLQCTPTLAASLIRQPLTKEALRSLRKMLVGGEALPLALAERLLEAIDGDLINMYGPTETTIWSTTAPVTRGAPISIGRPIVNTPIYLLGEDGRPCASGEICIGGAGVARGYWRRPELTAERFVVLDLDGVVTRVYKTGDRGRYLPDGTIEFLGRIDNQIKVRGYRVEPGEIEAVLMEHPLVARAVVTSFQRAGEDQLAAYVATEKGCEVAREELHGLLSKKLPAYMIPAAWVFLNELPTTPNGKLDRKALPAPTVAPAAAPEISGAATPLEKTIATVLGEALSLASVGLKQNFFDLGATSLIVAETAVALRETLGRPLKITDLFAHPTVSSLAAFLDGRDSSEEGFRDAAQRGAARRAARLSRRVAS
jgi:amino acid adenylation domain-containing protein